MSILALKLILSPIIIGSASLAGRKWGHAVSGWLIGLPLTSGPVIFFLSLSHDKSFVMTSVLGTLSGGFSLVAFCLSYAWLSTRFRWPIATIGSLVAYFVLVLLMQNILIPLLWLYLMVVLVILSGFRLMPVETIVIGTDSKPGAWDIPARILIGTSFILLLTESATFIGPRLTGLLATIPLYTVILTIFAHRFHGSPGAISVLRGLLFGMFAFAGFFLALGLLINHLSIGWAFVSAIAVALLVQGSSLLILRRKSIAKSQFEIGT